MPSQFFGLYIAGSGLRAASAGQNTTVNNISNIETPGYSRQQSLQEANAALRTFTTYGCAGAGVNTIAIERIRDHFYDVKYWNNASGLGKYDAQQFYMQTLEDYFADDEVSGFSTLFNKMSSALQSLAGESSTNTSKTNFVSSLKALTDYFNTMYGNLQEMQKDLNQEIKQTTDQINSIAERLAVLNKQINVIELSGSKANELRDKREKLVDELSLLVDVEVEEYPIYDASDSSRVTGASNYIVRIGGGQILTSGSDYNQLNCISRKSYEKVNQSDIDGLYDVEWSNGNSFSLNSPLVGGKLKGLVQMRDGNNGYHFHGKVTAVNTATPSKITLTPSHQDMQDMKLCGLSDTGGRIEIGGQVYYYSGWEYDKTTGQYTFTMDDGKCDEVINQSKLGAEAEIGNAEDYQGIPYYMTQMNSWIRGFAEKVNDIFRKGYDVNGNPGSSVFTGRKPTGGQYGVNDLDASAGNGYYELTAGNISILEELVDKPDRLGTRSTLEGVEERGQVDEMISLLNSKEKFNFRNGTAKEFLIMILGDVALNKSNADTFYKTQKGISKSIDNQRSSISGVDKDEETVNMVKFQNAYTLASKMIQTLTEIYDQLILRTGV